MTTSITSTTPVTLVRAREIMRAFLGLNEAARYVGASFTDDQRAALATVPFTEATLEECKDTHLLVAGYPMTVVDVRAKAPQGTFYSYENAWYNNEAFAVKEKVNVRWYLIRKGIVADSTRNTWGEQQTLLDPNEEVPRACEFVYAVVLYCLVTGERLFPNVYARCSHLASDGFRVSVGDFDAYGLGVNNDWGDVRYDRIGLASARKFD